MKYFIAILSLVSFSAISDPWSGDTKIVTLYPYNDGMIFMTEYSNTELSSCDNGHRFQVSKIHPNYDVLVSALIAAFIRLSIRIRRGFIGGRVLLIELLIPSRAGLVAIVVLQVVILMGEIKKLVVRGET